MEDYIQINCICEKSYIVIRTVKAKCPYCNHIWDLDPTMSKPDIKPLNRFNYNIETGIKDDNGK